MFLDFWKTDAMPQYILMCVLKKKKKKRGKKAYRTEEDLEQPETLCTG